MRIDTTIVHSATDLDPQHHSISPPIYQTSTFEWESFDQAPDYIYTRYSNPNRVALEALLCNLEGAASCTVVGSGVAASVAALSLFKSGDTIIMASDIYGGTRNICEKILPGHGIKVIQVDATSLQEVEQAVTPETKAILFETPSNPTLRVVDIRGIVAIAKRHGLLTILDNTFCTPILQNPIKLGIDIVTHSTTKSISGHSDLIGGAVLCADKAHGDLIYKFCEMNGACPSPFDCWLSLRGAKTLSLRIHRQCDNAEAVAAFLEKHPRVKAVRYPGLTNAPDHDLAKSQMSRFGAVVSFEVDGRAEHAIKVGNSTKIYRRAASLGGVESLVGYPTLMSHYAMSEEDRVRVGIPATLLRLSHGIEDPADLCEDLDQALKLAFA